jgi:hypothetical protein
VRSVRVTTAGDYATLAAGGWSFYYGYEFGTTGGDDPESVWGFEAKRDGGVGMRLGYDGMRTIPGCPDQFECQDCLLFGIGVYLASYADKDG